MMKGKSKDPLLGTLMQMIVFIGATCFIALGLAKRQACYLYFGVFLCSCFLISLPSFLFSVLTDFVSDIHEGLASGVFTVGGSIYALISVRYGN